MIYRNIKFVSKIIRKETYICCAVFFFHVMRKTGGEGNLVFHQKISKKHPPRNVKNF